MRVFLAAALLASMACAQNPEYECTHAVELMFLQDASTSFHSWIADMHKEVTALMDNFTATYHEFNMGLSAFVDKPIPTLGVGHSGNRPYVPADYCYQLYQPLSTSPGFVILDPGSGGKFRNAPLEGMAYAVGDESVGWSSGNYSEGGRPLTRIMLLVTDKFSHKPNDAATALAESWEAPRIWVNESFSTGGFGSISYFESGQIDRASRHDYMAMSRLFYRNDTGAITDEEAETLQKYITKFGPYPWPLVDNPNDGADVSLCGVTEYIGPEALGALLTKKGIVPIFLLVKNGRLDGGECSHLGLVGRECLQKYYENLLQEMGVSGVVSTTESFAVLKEAILEAVSSVAAGGKCPSSSSAVIEAA